MAIKAKAIVALLTMAACSPLAFAQDSAQGQTQARPPQQGQAQGQMQGPQGRRQMGPPPGPMGRRNTLDGGQRNGSMMGRAWQRRRAWRRYHRHHGFRGGPGARGFRGGVGMRPGFGPAMGRGMRPGMGPRGVPGLARFVNNPSMRQQLGITDEQAAKIRQQAEDFQKAGIQNRANMQVKRIELNDLLRADKPDRAAIDRKLAEVNAALGASEKTNIDHLLAMRSALTPEQQEKLKEMMQNRPGFGPRGPDGPGQRRPRQPQPQKQPGSESGSTDNSGTTI
jgi:Spy/CpxP family protein refolding chaperone